ncbi:TrbC family F-type conjugative pilus assembly protein [Endozoicomonas lisbonensis]|uniref:TrbC family F-type conjugative pilus assembly protein n=1 Tax=Endozoicomonas lisbonensis TaxID=3120522 RepID=UPI003391E193
MSCLVLCLWIPRVSWGQQPAITVQLFISESLGQTTITDILRTLPEDRSISIIARGLLPGDKPLNRTVRYWQTILEQSGTNHGIQIDPVAFSAAGITQVPTLLLSEGGKPLLKVAGVTSCEWLLRQFQIGVRGDLGLRGSAYPVSEPDLLEVLLKLIKQQDWQAVQAKVHGRLQSRNFSFGAKLPTSQQASSKVLKLSSHWQTPIIALDINDRQQQKAVIPWLQQHPDALVLVSNGSLQKFQTLPSIWQEHPIYIMPPELVHRFQLTALPALMTPESQNHWRVTTAEVSQFSAIEVMSWARALISKTTQPAYAVETTDNPSKALCQNVPILSEKLITSVPWKELFPIRIGLAKLGSGKEPNHRAKTSTGLCLCEDSAGIFHPGVTTGFWRPQRLIELTRGPGCLMALGGHKLPIADQRRWGTLGSANIPKGLTYMHAHVYSLPLIEMLNMYTGIGGCNSDLVDFDLMNLSEVDPSWNHPELAALLSPDLAAYANPSALNACTADGLSALNSQPMDSLHWCAGSWGNLYPLSGFTSTYGHFADNTSLLATRALAKIHRIGLARKTVGEDAQCHSRITPWLPKSQYKMSMFWPEPEKQQAHWIGASAVTWGMHRHPLGKDDAMYLLWQYRDCCQTAVSQ